MRTLAKSLCVRWPSVNARAGQILCVPTIFENNLDELCDDNTTMNEAMGLMDKNIFKFIIESVN